MKIEEIQSCLGDLLQDWKGSVQSLLYDESAPNQHDDQPSDQTSDQPSEVDSLEAKLKEIAAEVDVPPYWIVLSDLVQFAKNEASTAQKAQAEQPELVQPVLKATTGSLANNGSLSNKGSGNDVAEPILVANAKADPQAFGVLYERYMERIYSYIYRRVGNTQDTEDLTAHTFYKALDKLNSYEDRGYPFSAWLFRIAHNLVANWHRDSGRRRFLPLDRLWTYSADSETPDQRMERDEKHTALWDAINRLPPERRDLLMYKFSNCLSNVEIGKLMNKSESAIKSLYFRTLAALRQDLEATEIGR